MIETELELQAIGRLQEHLRPHSLPRIPGWEIATYSKVDVAGGGDFVDVLPMADSRFGFLVADFSGHGPAAAVLTAMTRMLLHACPITSGQGRAPYCPIDCGCVRSPDVVVAHLNRVLVENTLDEQFMTMVFGVVDRSTSECQISIAGHMAPCWWQARNHTFGQFPDIAGLPLGVDSDAQYAAATVCLQPGDVLLLYSDGFSEAQDRTGVMYGRARIEQCLMSTAGADADAIAQAVANSLRAFLHGASPHDDLSLLVIKKCADCEASELYFG